MTTTRKIAPAYSVLALNSEVSRCSSFTLWRDYSLLQRDSLAASTSTRWICLLRCLESGVLITLSQFARVPLGKGSCLGRTIEAEHIPQSDPDFQGVERFTCTRPAFSVNLTASPKFRLARQNEAARAADAAA